jgi:hypothetical protein
LTRSLLLLASLQDIQMSYWSLCIILHAFILFSCHLRICLQVYSVEKPILAKIMSVNILLGNTNHTHSLDRLSGRVFRQRHTILPVRMGNKFTRSSWHIFKPRLSCSTTSYSVECCYDSSLWCCTDAVLYWSNVTASVHADLPKFPHIPYQS